MHYFFIVHQGESEYLFSLLENHDESPYLAMEHSIRVAGANNTDLRCENDGRSRLGDEVRRQKGPVGYV